MVKDKFDKISPSRKSGDGDKGGLDDDDDDDDEGLEWS